MKLDKIITLANKNTELRFLAMVRSLRAVGCHLPVWVIPYDNNLFQLPENCIWWKLENLTSWLDNNNSHKTMRKYQCLLTSNYQFADADIIFLLNPEIKLQGATGFITSCCHWNNPAHTYTAESLQYLKSKNTTWQKSIFNSGQFACDVELYNIDQLKTILQDQKYKETCLNFKYHEQPGLNLLVHLSNVPVHNLTLPPYNMQSTHAADYNDNFTELWDLDFKKPYLIHWAGCRMDKNRPIDKLFTDFLTLQERESWNHWVKKKQQQNKLSWRIKDKLRSIRYAARTDR